MGVVGAGEAPPAGAPEYQQQTAAHFLGGVGFLLAEVVLHKKSVLPFCVLPCFYANFTKS